MSAVMAVLASYSVVGPVSAFAASLAGSGFEIDDDANLVVDGGGGAVDWLAGGSGSALRSGVLVKHDLPSGTADDSFTQGTAEDDTTPTVATGSIPPSKSDLKDFGVYVEKTATQTFLNVFWTRVQDPTGTTNMDFEFNQSAATANNPPDAPQVVPVRTAGDLLLTYDLDKGGKRAVISKRFWTGTKWGAATALTDAQALGTVNGSALAAAGTGGLGALDPRTFGEASVDLAALLPAEQGCTTYGSAYVKSRSSDSFTAELKDFIAPQGVSISNCGTVQIHKTDDNGALAGAGFTLYKDVAPLGGTAAGAEDKTAANAVGTCTTSAGGDCGITDVAKGDYWLVETAVPAAHDPAPDQHVSITAGDQVVSLTLNDPVQHGTITITKDAQPNDDQDFSFTLDGSPFSLDDDSDPTLPNSRTFTVVAGTHSASEVSIPAGWQLTGLVCTDPTHDTTTSGATATIKVAKDETVSCTYTDAFTRLDTGLTTQVAAAGGGAWNDTATLTGDGTHPVTGTVAFFACAPTASPNGCATGGSAVGTPVAVALKAGTAATYQATTNAAWNPASAGWTCFRAEFTSTSAFYVNSSHTNATTECFLKQNQDLTVSKTATAAYGRVYSWTIDKAVDKTRVEVAAGGSASFDYTVKVGNTHVDSAWTVTGTITVTNPNPVAFTGVAVTDAIDNGAGSCAVTGGSNATVPANGTLQLPYTCTYASAPSPLKGTNTATATWSSATFFTAHDSATGTAGVDFATVTPTTTDEVVTVTDTVQGTLGTVDARTAQNPTTFSYTVVRSGVAGTCTDYDNTATYTTNDTASQGSDSQSVTVCAGADLTVATTANGSKARDYLWSIAKDVDRTRVEMASGSTATFQYDVTVTPTGVDDSAYALSGLITVSNPNDWQDVVANVTDTVDVGGGASCTVTGGTGVTVPKGGSVQLPYSCTFTSAPAASGTSTATATWSAATYHTPSGTASGTAPVSFAVGTETHKTITVVDDKTDPANPVVLGTWSHGDGAHTFTYSIAKAGVAGQCTSYTNTATISETGQSASKTVTVCVGLDLTVTKTALATDHRTFLWSLAKDVDQTRRTVAPDGTATFHYTVTATPAGTTDDGWSVTGQITVSNPNAWQDVTASVTDVVDTGGGADCVVGDGQQVVVPALGSAVLDYRCTFGSEPTDGTNTATASWDRAAYATPTGSATGTAAVVFVPSSTTDETVTVVDDKTDPLHPVTLGTATYGDGPATFTYDVSLPGTAGTCTPYTNTATISETQQSAQQTVDVCSGAGLVLAGEGAGTFDRTYGWTIDKAVDRTTVTTAAAGDTATFTYTVTVTPDGFTDGDYALGGSVTVTNPNDWEDVLANVTVATDLGGGAVCTVTDGTGRSVPKGGALTLPYTCTFTGAPATTGTVTASVGWDSTAAATTGDSAELPVAVALAQVGATNRTVDVVDDMTDPAHPVALGTATFDDGAQTFTYSIDKTSAEGTCTEFTNTASIVQTAQEASATASVCGPVTGGGGTPVVNPPAPPTGGGGLPFTGDLTGLLGRWALAMVLAGAVLVLVGRRPRTQG